jgi:hypothetical protein
MTLSVMTLRIKTLRTTAPSMMTFRKKTFSTTSLSIMKDRIITLSTPSFGIMTLVLKKLDTAKSECDSGLYDTQYNGVQNKDTHSSSTKCNDTCAKDS